MIIGTLSIKGLKSGGGGYKRVFDLKYFKRTLEVSVLDRVRTKDIRETWKFMIKVDQSILKKFAHVERMDEG